MRTLFIDTHLSDINIILFDEYQIVKEKQIIGQKHNSVYLMPTVKEVIDGQSYDEIVVVNGPGSFTGVRLGVTVAKTLAYVKKIPIKTITSLDILNYSCEEAYHICAISDDNGYFIGEYLNYQKTKEY